MLIAFTRSQKGSGVTAMDEQMHMDASAASERREKPEAEETEQAPAPAAEPTTLL